MKSLSFKIVLLALLLPPLGYLAVTTAVQRFYLDGPLAKSLAVDIHAVSVRNIDDLLAGRAELRDSVNRNIGEYLARRRFLRFIGIQVQVTVFTRDGALIYPQITEIQNEGTAPGTTGTSMEMARGNLNILDQGLVVKARLRLATASLFSLLVLLVLLGISVGIVALHFRRVGHTERLLTAKLNRLLKKELRRTSELEKLTQDRSLLQADLDGLRENLQLQRDQASRNEDGMVTEIENLEKRLAENQALQESQQSEISALNEKIEELEKTRRKEPGSRKEPLLHKRLKAVYKNLLFSDRAVDGFSDLDEELRIKCEELIHQLNDDPGLVTIKRKVFGKKGRQTVLEVMFGYKGRLYFRKTKEGRIDILVIGTKNSQPRDLDYLNGL